MIKITKLTSGMRNTELVWRPMVSLFLFPGGAVVVAKNNEDQHHLSVFCNLVMLLIHGLYCISLYGNPVAWWHSTVIGLSQMPTYGH